MLHRNTLGTLTLSLLLMACGGEAPETQTASDGPEEPTLTAFELEHGIGPFTEEVQLGAIDAALAARGQELFETSCEICHQLGQRFVGPDLEGVLDRRSPTFVMNMIMNPEEMAFNHPVTMELMREFMAPMPYQNVTTDDTRAIVEYLRTVGGTSES